jgi:hypothetical protein
MQALQAHGADVTLADAEGRTALHAAALLGDCGKLRAIVQAAPEQARHVLLGAADGGGLLPLHAACCAVLCSTECVHVLLSADAHAAARVGARDRMGRTPLVHAAKGACCGTVQYLLKCGADVHALDACAGRSAACVAALGMDGRLVRALLHAGAGGARARRGGGGLPA